MASLIGAIFSKITSVFTAVLITVGVISAPAIQVVPATNSGVVVAPAVEKKVEGLVQETITEKASVGAVKITPPPTPKPTTTSVPPSIAPSGTIPATPATPAEPAQPTTGAGTPAIPATPAVPATPATPTKPATDTTFPIISNIQAADITETSAVITWTTDEPASGEVYYAASNTPIFATTTTRVIGADGVINHSINLSNLADSAVYYYIAVSKDAAGNTATSSEQSFTTLTPPPPPPPVSNWSNNSLNVSGEYQSIAWNGNGYGAVYGLNGKLHFIKLDSSGNKLHETVLATAPNYVFWTNIIWDGSKYGIVWSEANPSNLLFATVDTDGNVLSSVPLTVGTDNASTERPAMIWTGNDYAIAWSGGWPDNYNNPYIPQKIVYFTKIASDGQTLIINKKKSITNGDARASVSLTWNGIGFGVAWQDIRDSGNTNNPAIYFTTLDSEGNKLGDDVKISGNGRAGSPNIFSDGANYDILWKESAVSDVNANSIYFTKVDAIGNKLVVNTNLNTKGDNELSPSVAKTNSGYGIVWTSHPEQKLYFKFVNLSASIVLDNNLVSIPSGSNDRAYLTWSNGKYGVIWRNVENNQSQLYFGTK